MMKRIFTAFLVMLFACSLLSAQAPVIVLVTDADRDDAQFEFLKRQGFVVQKVWPGRLSEVGPDTIALLNALADLVIIGRSPHSSNFQQEVDKLAWNALTVPVILNAQYVARSSRLNWFESTNAYHLNELPVVAHGVVADPSDTIFSTVTLLEGDSLAWSHAPNDFIGNDSLTNGTVLASYDGRNPLVVRFDAGVEFYPGSVDMPAGPRTYFGFGNDALNFDYPNFFNLTKEAKAVYLAEICRLVGVPVQEPVFGPEDQRIILLSDDEYDYEQHDWLMNQGFHVTKWWIGEMGDVGESGGDGSIAEAGQDTIDMLNAADLLIVGRSPHSRNFQQAEDKVVWNALTAPLILNGQYLARSSRLNWFESTNAYHMNDDPELAYGVVATPADPIFNAVTLMEGDSLGWSWAPNDFIGNDSATNADILVSFYDRNPLVARFDADVEFYPGAVDMPAGPRTYFGFGNDATGPSNFFPLTQDAKKVYLAEICRLTGLDVVPEVVLTAADYNVTLITDDQYDNPQYDFLTKNGIRVTKFWHGTVGEEGSSGGDRSIAEVGQDTIDMLNAADLLIVGRSPHSRNFQDSVDRVTWNALTAPLILNGQYLARSSRLNWFESTNAYHENEEPAVAYGVTDVPDDIVFSNVALVEGDSLAWCLPPHDFIGNDSATNGDIIASFMVRNPLLARFDAGVEFYPEAVDMPAGPRTYFGMGNDATGPSNFFPLTEEAQQVYLNEISRMLGAELSEVRTVDTDASLESLEYDIVTATLDPAFDPDSMTYTLQLVQDSSVVDLMATPSSDMATVEGDSTIDVSAGDTITVDIVVTAENGAVMTYEVTVLPFIDDTGIEPESIAAAAVRLYPNPASDLLYIESDMEIKQVTVFNAIGKIVMQHSSVNNPRLQLNVGSLTPGLYMIKVDNEDQSSMNKLLKK